MALSFKGRDLSEDEEACILQTIHANSDLDVVCLVDPDKMKEEMYSKALNDRLAELNNNMGQFFKGNLRSGQVLEFDTSVVILGDINAGAQVVSTGNVVILGALNWKCICRGFRPDKFLYLCLENESAADPDCRCNCPFIG